MEVEKVGASSVQHQPNPPLPHHIKQGFGRAVLQSAVERAGEKMSCTLDQNPKVFEELWDVVRATKDDVLCGYVNDWWSDPLEFQTGCLWKLLDLNVSNLKDVFDYQILDRVWLPRAIHRSQYHVLTLLRNLENQNWLDQWAAVASDHLMNVTATWMHQLFSSEDSEDSEEDDVDGPLPWPPAPANPDAWFVSTVAAFGMLETAFEGLESIFALQGLDKANQFSQDFHRQRIQRPLEGLKKMRELLVSKPKSLRMHHSKLAWCIFANLFLESAIKMQSLLLCTS